ncbi:MAG: NADH:ubiquinone reductase (Na(+)-transporting) subunit C [Salinivirgaceae bacterium]|nr:NADH:ubiquinone reductase (Na(+)-transporting) subunit C [Salinivirgaceae bacterium]
MAKFKCKVCGYIHEGSSAPAECPTCKAPASEFVEEKKKISTNSNGYTLIYAAVMVVIVAFLLAAVSSALKAKQDDNVKLATKKQILSAVNINSTDANADFNKYVKAVLDTEGNEKGAVADFNVIGSEKYNVVYKCELPQGVKYIIPLVGNGLWGAIGGYISVDENKSTVYGVFFTHDSETPGLGAKITTDEFRNQFVGKNILRDSALTSIAVVKAGTAVNDKDQVDAISGGTLTSNGVNDMLEKCLGNFNSFLTK